MLANGVKETTATTGTGTVTLSAVTGFPRFSQVLGVGQFVDYAIQDGNNWEWGVGKVAASNTLERTLVTAKFDGGTYSKSPAAALSLSGSATVFCSLGDASVLPTYQGSQTGWHLSMLEPYCAPAGGGVTFTADVLWAVPFLCGMRAKLTKVGFYVPTAAAAGKVIRAGVYGCAANGTAGALLSETNSVAVDSTGFKSLTLSAPISPQGWVYVALLSDGTPAVEKSAAWNGARSQSPLGVASGAFTYAGQRINSTVGAGWSAMPATLSSPSYTTNQDAFRVMLGE